jgi:hypothetical protein
MTAKGAAAVCETSVTVKRLQWASLWEFLARGAAAIAADDYILVGISFGSSAFMTLPLRFMGSSGTTRIWLGRL